MNPLFGLFSSTVARCADQDLWRFRTLGGRWNAQSFRQVSAEVDQRATALVRRGLVPGTRVLVLVPPGPTLFAVLLSLFQAGAVPVLADPRIGLRAFVRCLSDARPVVVIAPPLFLFALRALHLIPSTVRHHWSSTLPRGTTGIGEVGKRGLHDEAAVVFTSGSTGVPKAVVLTHENLLTQCRQVRSVWSETGVDLPTLPLFALLDAFTGTTAVLPPGGFRLPSALSPRRLAKAIHDQGVSILFLSPVVLRTLGRWCQRHGRRLGTLRQVFTAGAVAPAADVERFQALLGPEGTLTALYGATECLVITTISSSEALATAAQTRHGVGVCVGRPVSDVEVRIGGPEIPGEILVKGAGVSPGYSGSARVDPWHPTGDMGFFDDQQRLWFVGRKSHRVLTSQGALYPEQVEGRFNQRAPLGRTALGLSTEPTLWIETREWGWWRSKRPLVDAVRGGLDPWTGAIRFRHRFPTDARHSSKILRERLTS